MKQYLILILAILVLALGLMGCSQKITTYCNRAHGYCIDHPSDWKVSQLSTGETTMLSPDSYVAIIISRLHNVAPGYSMKEYSHIYIGHCAENYKGFELINLNELSSTDYQLDYKRDDRRWRSYIILRGGWVYMITYASSPSVFLSYIPTLDQVYSSFRLIPAQ